MFPAVERALRHFQFEVFMPVAKNGGDATKIWGDIGDIPSKNGCATSIC